MKYLINFVKKKEVILVGIFVLIAFFLHMKNVESPCLNSDEASFGYNAYSILQTGQDEYGKTMPVRFQAFGENKLPITVYSIVPFIGMFGLNDIAVRLPFIIIGILAPILFYFLAKSIFDNKTIALIAAFLASVSPWIEILSRHVHEDTIILVLTIIILQLLIKLTNYFSYKTLTLLSIVTGLSLFTYHIGKLLTLFVFGWIITLMMENKPSMQSVSKVLLIVLVPILLFSVSELMQPSSRINNLLFTNNDGFKLTIDHLRSEHNSRAVHNKITYAATVISNQYLSYFSPEFLVTVGDRNERFGMKGISPISPIEYTFFIIGLYFIFHRKEKHRMLLSSLLFIAPIAAALSWQTSSLTRAYLMIIPILLLSAYGMYWSVQSVSNKKMRLLLAGGIGIALLFFVFLSWDFYFHHYLKRTESIRAWQCGYKELVSYIDNSYDSIDKYYITKRHGQPYIFTLFYLKYPPNKYQPQAKLSELGEYGFGQVEAYDKFIFTFTSPKVTESNQSVAYIGYPEEFNGTGITEHNVQKMQIGDEDIFWIYEINK